MRIQGICWAALPYIEMTGYPQYAGEVAREEIESSMAIRDEGPVAGWAPYTRIISLWHPENGWAVSTYLVDEGASEIADKRLERQERENVSNSAQARRGDQDARI